MEKDLNLIKNAFIHFFEYNVSKTEISTHRKKIEENSKKISTLKKNNKLSDKDKKKLETLLSNQAVLELETPSLRKKAIDIEIPDWLDETAEKGLVIRPEKASKKATHLLKFTHSSANHFSVRVNRRKHFNSVYLSTEGLNDDYYDIAHSNGAYITISKFFLVKIENELIIDKIMKSDFGFLDIFDTDNKRKESWENGLTGFINDDPKCILERSKQIYFPYNDGYHLITPLFSSSLSEALTKKIKDSRYNDDNRESRKARKDKKYSTHINTYYPQAAIQRFGGEHPKNISPLNVSRSGKSLLLPCQPPRWQSQLKPPLTPFAFWGRYTRRVRPIVKRLVNFLQSVRDFNNQAVRNTRADYVNELIEKFIFAGAEIRGLRSLSGWSSDSSISDAGKYWLDPYRQDEDFQTAREASDWKDDIADQFALWLNRQLRYYKLNVAGPEHGVWRKEAKNKLREEMEGFDQ